MANVNINLKRGEELNQLSRLLFDTAARKWYVAFGLELVAGLASVVLSLLPSLSDTAKLLSATATALLLVVAYVLRQKFENQYDMAETMRRQSVLTEGLGYPIKIAMFSEWRRRVGKRVLAKFTLTARNNDYYVTKRRPSAKRLLEMTQESAFWTRFLYSKLLDIAWIACGVSTLMLTAVVVALLLGAVPKGATQTFTYGVFLVIPVLLTSNIIGWVLKLKRLVGSICDIEKDMEELAKLTRPDEASVLRLVFEYNCQVVAGFPIPSFVFNREYARIQQEWDNTH